MRPLLILTALLPVALAGSLMPAKGKADGKIPGKYIVKLRDSSGSIASLCPKGIVANFSVGCFRNRAYNDAAAALAASGIFVVAAAGNENMDTKFFSPGSEPFVCTVGGTYSNDHRVDSSNYGLDVNIHALGFNILTTFNDGNTTIKSGTSFAAPHVAGLGAYLLGLGKPSTDLCKTIQKISTRGAITIHTLPRGTRNLLAFNSATSCAQCVKKWWGEATKKAGDTAKKQKE